MQIFKPFFWNKKNSLFSIMLIPISILLQFIIKIKKKFSTSKKFNIPIICVGNIYIGGTGKTPLSILIANELRKNELRPVIIKKYYKSHKDEHELIKSKNENLILKNNRVSAIKEAEMKNFNIAILDDGFQDYSIKKNLNILCFNTRQLVGNNFTFPSGPLRESMQSIKDSQIIVLNGHKNEDFEKKIFSVSKEISIYYSKYNPLNINLFKGKKIFAFAGIGNPDNFFHTLIENKIKIIKKIKFPDHYNFSKLEIQKMVDFSNKNNLELVTTEKDYYRIKSYGFKNIHYLKIELEIFEINKFLNEIKNNL